MVGAVVNTCALCNLRRRATVLAEHLHICIVCLAAGKNALPEQRISSRQVSHSSRYVATCTRGVPTAALQLHAVWVREEAVRGCAPCLTVSARLN